MAGDSEQFLAIAGLVSISLDLLRALYRCLWPDSIRGISHLVCRTRKSLLRILENRLCLYFHRGPVLWRSNRTVG